MTTQRQLWIPPDVEEAAATWGANCGPIALAAGLRRTLAQVRPLLGTSFKGYMNARDMLDAVKNAGRLGRLVEVEQGWQGTGFVRIQWEGPWLREGVPIGAALAHTHWVFALDGRVFDCNFEPLRYDTWGAWEYEVAAPIIQLTRGATGWRIRDVIVRA